MLASSFSTMRPVLLLFAGLVLSSCDSTPDPCEIRGSTPATATSTVSIDYRGHLADGFVFDERFCFVSEVDLFVPGLRDGVVGMVPGEEKTITVPPEEGFGDQQVGIVPPNSTLTFFVRLRSAE